MRPHTLRMIRIALLAALVCTSAATLLTGRHFLMLRYALQRTLGYPESGGPIYHDPLPWASAEHAVIVLAALCGVLFVAELILFGMTRSLDWSRSLLATTAAVLPTAAFLIINRGYEFYGTQFGYGGSLNYAGLATSPAWRIVGDSLIIISVAAYGLLLFKSRSRASYTHTQSPSEPPTNVLRVLLGLLGAITVVAFVTALILYHRYIMQLFTLATSPSPDTSPDFSVFPIYFDAAEPHTLVATQILIIIAAATFILFWLLCTRAIGRTSWRLAWLLTACMFIPAAGGVYLVPRTLSFFGRWYGMHLDEYWVDPERTHLLREWSGAAVVVPLLILLLVALVRQIAINQAAAAQAPRPNEHPNQRLNQ